MEKDPHSIHNHYWICQFDSGIRGSMCSNDCSCGSNIACPRWFDCSGQWNCGDGASIAHLEVENQNRSIGGASLRLPVPWTEIRESQDGFNGDYFVGYDRDKSQLLMIDADDPASAAYFTESWNGKMLLLTSTNDKGQLAPPHRIQYDINDSHRFTVTWEVLEAPPGRQN